MRFSLSLCENEKQFRMRRKRKVLKTLQSIMSGKSPNSLDETPTVAVMGSGGGIRAMVGYLGCLKALEDMGVLDAATYLSGLSGSTWFDLFSKV